MFSHPFEFTPSAHGTSRAGIRERYKMLYCAHSEMENRIKEQQLGLFADHTSTATLRTNQRHLQWSPMR